MNLRKGTQAVGLTAALLLTLAACAPSYDPACQGQGEQPLAANALAQPSGMALHNGKLYVANSASIAPVDDHDYCGSFISVLDPQTGSPLQRPFVPREAGVEDAEEEFRFFSAVTYDTERDVLYVGERQRGSVLKVDPSNGRILARVAAGHSPYDVLLIPDVPTEWENEAPAERDVIAVADIGEGGAPGHLYVIDADDFSFRSAREVPIGLSGRPSSLRFDAATATLWVTLFDGSSVIGVDIRTLEVISATEPALTGYTLFIRGVAPVTSATGQLLYFTSESSAYDGIWTADPLTGQLLGNLKLPVAPFALAGYDDKLIALARNRLYVLGREPLRLETTILLDTGSPARLLVDENRRMAYVTSTVPSAVRLVELP
jgi:DNA-binding beta-propeller fold protein YncE